MHKSSPDEYLDEHGLKDYETKAVYWRCLKCDEIIKRHFTSITGHLTKHEISVKAYLKNYGEEELWEVSTRGPLGDAHKINPVN